MKDWEKEELPFMSGRSSFEEARCVVVPLPYSSVSYTKGTVDAPRAIIYEWKMEDFDLETGYSPSNSGIYIMPEVEIESLSKVRELAKQAVTSGKFPIFLGGDHSITIGTTSAYGNDVSVLILDAHSDLRDEYEGSKESHGCVARRVSETHQTVQIGVRSIGSEELEVAKKRPAYGGVGQGELEGILERLGRDVYISIDVDVLDPSVMPAVALPEPNGLLWGELLSILKKVFERRNIVGCDICELFPVENFWTPNALCAHLAYKLIAYKFASGSEK